MKLLQLDPDHRRWLNLKCALELSAHLTENFVGLTHRESVLLAKMTSEPCAALETFTADEIMQLIELHDRHRDALSLKTTVMLLSSQELR